MSAIEIVLTGCSRYNYKGELYETKKVYRVGEVKATILLRDRDDYGRPYFIKYVKPEKSRAQVVAEAAAARAILEAAKEEFVERPDGSEPVVIEEVVADAVPEEVDVDHDDDPSLDEDDDVNPEEIDLPAENEDRDDGTAEEV